MQLIKKSVGKGGTNDESDAKAVQELLNKFMKLGGYQKLGVDGKVGKLTIEAISAFQKNVMGMKRPDGLVEPGRDTLKKLNESPKAVEKEEKEKGKEEGGGGKKRGKILGETTGVGKDILDYLMGVADHYGLSINITSGRRSPDEQGEAMFDNWIKLKRGNVYKSSTLSNSDKKKLDEFYIKAVEDKKASSADKKKAENDFKALATDKVGAKSKHASGRAVDVAQRSVTSNAYKAIVQALKEVPEGGRTDIYHFESDSSVPFPSDDIKAKWPKP